MAACSRSLLLLSSIIRPATVSHRLCNASHNYSTQFPANRQSWTKTVNPSKRRLLSVSARLHQEPSQQNAPKSADAADKDNAVVQETIVTRPEKRKDKAVSDVSLSDVRRLMSLAKPERKTLTIAAGLLLVSSSVSLSVPMTLGKIIDLFTNPEAASNLPLSLPTAAGLLAFFFAVGAAANMGRSVLMRISGQRIVNSLRNRAYANVLRQDEGWYDLQGQPSKALSAAHKETPVLSETDAKTVEMSKLATESGVRGTGDIISRLGSDSGIVGESLTRELSEGLRATVTTIVGLGAMIYISSKLTLVMLCIVPPVSIAAVIYGRYLKKLSRATQRAVGDMIHVAEERLSAIRTVHSFNAAEPYETQRFANRAGKILDLAKKEAWASGLFYGGAGFSGNLALLALLSYGGSLVSRGEITVGDLSSLMLYSAYIGGSLVGLTSFFSSIMKGLGASSRVFELLDAQPISVVQQQGKLLSPSDPPKQIVFENIHFKYPARPSVEILKGVSFSIEPGHSVAIAGVSGSGKSTIASLLVRFYDPAAGRIVYGGDNIKDFTPESWRNRVAFVPQEPALFSQTIAENIAYGRPDATLSEIKEAAKLANCDFIDTLPHGFDTQVGPRAAQLSGGQRQRLSIARALLRQPAVLVLDEATSALDAASEVLVNKAVQNITASRSVTSILIAHRLSTLRTADRIIYLEDGQIKESGTYAELTRKGTRFSEMVSSQLLSASS